MSIILINDVPEYLQHSPLYCSTVESGEVTTICVPDGCLRQDAPIVSAFEFNEFLQTVKFWQFPDVILTSPHCFDYALSPFQRESALKVIVTFEGTIPQLNTLKSIVEAAPSLQMEHAARAGALYVVKYLIEEGKVVTIEAILDAAAGGHVACLRSLLHKEPKLKKHPYISGAAATGGHIACLQFCLEFGCRVTEHTAVEAAKCGSLECLIMLHLHHQDWDVQAARTAAYYGHLECLRYVCERLYPSWGVSDRDFYIGFNDVPACDGQVECLQYMQSLGYRPSTPNMEIYVTKDHHHTIEFLLQHCDVKELDWASLLEVAVRDNKLECAEVLVEHMSAAAREASTACAMVAIYRGKIEYLILFMTNGFPWDGSTLNEAASVGNVEAVSFLHDNGCPWDATTTAAAAGTNELACLSFLHENGCPWNASTCVAALEEDAHECLAYALDNDCPSNEDVISKAVTGGKVQSLRYLIDMGKCPLTINMATLAAQQATPAVLQLLHEKGCPWDESTCAAAVKYRRWACFQFAYENDCPCEMTAAVRTHLNAHWDYVSIGGGIPPTTEESRIRRAVHYSTPVYVRFLRDTGHPWSELFATLAVVEDFPICLQYVLAHGCPAPADLATVAAELGRGECLEVAVEFGHLPTSDACLRMVKKNCMDLLSRVLELGGVLDAACTLEAVTKPDAGMLQFLHMNGARWDEHTFRAAVTNGDLSCVKYMFENSCPLDFMHSVTLAAQHGHTSVVAYLRERRLPWTTNTCAVAAQAGHISCLAYLHVSGCPWDVETTVMAGTQECFDYAVRNGCPNTLRNVNHLQYSGDLETESNQF